MIIVTYLDERHGDGRLLDLSFQLFTDADDELLRQNEDEDSASIEAFNTSGSAT